MDPKVTIKNNLKRRSQTVDIVNFHKDIPIPTWVELSLIDVCNRKCIFQNLIQKLLQIHIKE